MADPPRHLKDDVAAAIHDAQANMVRESTGAGGHLRGEPAGLRRLLDARGRARRYVAPQCMHSVSEDATRPACSGSITMAQESLPFPPTPSARVAGRTMQEKDLAKQNGAKVEQMKETFTIEAAKNLVYPVGDGLWVMVHPADMAQNPAPELLVEAEADELFIGCAQPRNGVGVLESEPIIAPSVPLE